MKLTNRHSGYARQSVLLTSLFKPRTSVIPIASTEEEEPVATLSEAWAPLVKILKRPPYQRTSRSLQSLVAFTRNIKLFKELAAEVSEEAVTQCCLHMTYEFYPQGAFIFHQGSEGSKFYILLNGTCTVYVRSHDSPSSVPVSQYMQGDYFGELALIHNKPRAASIECVSDVHLAVLSKDDYVRILSKAHETALNRKAEFLHQLPMFGGWTMGSMQKLIYYFKDKLLQRKQVLYKSGDVVDTVYFILDGELQIVQDVRLQVPGAAPIPKVLKKKAEVVTLGKGECVGADEVIGSGVYPFTALCASVTARVLAISKDDFLKRVNTEETLAAIRELTKVKEGLRKKQIEGGRNVRSNDHFDKLLQAQSEPITTASTPLGSPKSQHSLLTLLCDSEFRPKKKYCRSPELSSALQDKYWDEVLSRKSLATSTQGRPKQSLRKIVNIHTHKWKQQDWKLPDGRLSESVAALVTARRLLTSIEASSDLPSLQINTMGMTERASPRQTWHH